MGKLYEIIHDDQGVVAAFNQYFTIDEKPRLYRKNTYFEDLTLDNSTASKLWILGTFLVLAIAIIMVVMSV